MMNAANFYSGRAYFQSALTDDHGGWFFQVRGARTFGPFIDREEMLLALRAFVKACVATGDSGGRPHG